MHVSYLFIYWMPNSNGLCYMCGREKCTCMFRSHSQCIPTHCVVLGPQKTTVPQFCPLFASELKGLSLRNEPSLTHQWDNPRSTKLEVLQQKYQVFSLHLICWNWGPEISILFICLCYVSSPLHLKCSTATLSTLYPMIKSIQWVKSHYASKVTQWVWWLSRYLLLMPPWTCTKALKWTFLSTSHLPLDEKKTVHFSLSMRRKTWGFETKFALVLGSPSDFHIVSQFFKLA